jgi:hypothetical protein
MMNETPRDILAARLKHVTEMVESIKRHLESSETTHQGVKAEGLKNIREYEQSARDLREALGRLETML